MTSKQAMQKTWSTLLGSKPGVSLLMLSMFSTLVMTSTVGCRSNARGEFDSPYGERRLWAVAPLRDESGSGGADGVRVADHVAQALTRVRGLEVLPLNRTLAVMESLEMTSIDSRDDAIRLRRAMKVDGLVAGTITAYDPYDPPKLGMTLELYAEDALGPRTPIDPRQLSRSPTGNASVPDPRYADPDQPVVAVSGLIDGRTESTRDALIDYVDDYGEGDDQDHAYRLYLMSMDLFTQFVTHQMGSRLIRAEAARTARAQREIPVVHQPGPS